MEKESNKLQEILDTEGLTQVKLAWLTEDIETSRRNLQKNSIYCR